MQIIENDEQIFSNDNTSAVGDTIQFNSFFLGDIYFCINISEVKEVIRNHRITGVPRSPEYLKGLINLRGNIVSVIDPIIKMNIATNKETSADSFKTNRIMLLKSKRAGEELIGLLVDSVSDVFEVKPSQLESVPSHFADIDRKFVKNICKLDQSLLIVLDPEKLIEE